MSETLEILRDVLGDLDTERLLRAHGGTRITIPQTAAGTRLARDIGEKATERLIETFVAGTRLTLPIGGVRGRDFARSQAKKMLTEGVSHQKVANEADVHIRTVERWAQELREDSQLSFPFDD